MHNVNEELSSVNDTMFFCSMSKIRLHFHFCMDRERNMPIEKLREKYVGCVLEMPWLCQTGNRGDWYSSQAVNQFYISNIHAAS